MGRRTPAILGAVTLLVTTTSQLAQGDAQTTLLPAGAIPLAQYAVPPWIPPATLIAPHLADRHAAIERWTREYADWMEWNDRWQGRPEPGWFEHRERREKPVPPDWLFDECLDVDDDSPTIDACRLLESWKSDVAAARLTRPVTPREDPARTTFWNHVHADALWMTPNSSSSYGVIGIHVTLKVAGRWQVFVAPGAMLLNLPTAQGTRAWQPAADLGFSYRLFDVPLPGGRGQGTVHLNVARAWIMGGSESPVNSSLDLAGLSLTFK